MKQTAQSYSPSVSNQDLPALTGIYQFLHHSILVPPPVIRGRWRRTLESSCHRPMTFLLLLAQRKLTLEGLLWTHIAEEVASAKIRSALPYFCAIHFRVVLTVD